MSIELKFYFRLYSRFSFIQLNSYSPEKRWFFSEIILLRLVQLYQKIKKGIMLHFFRVFDTIYT